MSEVFEGGLSEERASVGPRSFPEMSLFFFRLHNLQRAQGERRAGRGARGRRSGRDRAQSRSGGSGLPRSPPTARPSHRGSSNSLTTGPSRLFERAPLHPSDSLDEIASHIPRWHSWLFVSTAFRRDSSQVRTDQNRCGQFYHDFINEESLGRVGVFALRRAIDFGRFVAYALLLRKCQFSNWLCTSICFARNAYIYYI